MCPQARKPGKSSGRATVLFAAISILVGMADEATGQWKPMELATGYLEPISGFDSTVFGVGLAGLWRDDGAQRGSNSLFRQGASLIAADTQAVYRSADSGASGNWTFQGPGSGAEGFLEMVSVGKFLVARVLVGSGGVVMPNLRRIPSTLVEVARRDPLAEKKDPESGTRSINDDAFLNPCDYL